MMERTTLGEVLIDIQAGKSFLTAETIARPDEIGVLKVSAVTWSKFQPNEAKALKSDYAPSSNHRVRSGDFIISRANTKDFVGAVVLVDEDHPNRLLSDKTLRLVVDETQMSKEFLLYALRSKLAREHIESHATGTSDSMRNISHGVIRSIPIPFTDIDTQREIACRLKAQLAEVEIARSAAIQQIHESRALFDAIYNQAFRSLAPIDVPPATQEPPRGWSWRKLTDLARLESGHTPSRLRPDWWGGDISWLSLTEIRALDGKWVDETTLRTNSEGIANSAARVLPRGTVCLSRTASVGFVAIMGKPMATSQDFANWVCGKDLDPDFLMHAFIRSRTALREMAMGATHKTIYMPALESFLVCAPDIEEQKRIANDLKSQLTAVEALRTGLTQRADDISALPQRILASAFGI
jgi:type I restriction enzyme S subunit